MYVCYSVNIVNKNIKILNKKKDLSYELTRLTRLMCLYNDFLVNNSIICIIDLFITFCGFFLQYTTYDSDTDKVIARTKDIVNVASSVSETLNLMTYTDSWRLVWIIGVRIIEAFLLLIYIFY